MLAMRAARLVWWGPAVIGAGAHNRIERSFVLAVVLATSEGDAGAHPRGAVSQERTKNDRARSVTSNDTSAPAVTTSAGAWFAVAVPATRLDAARATLGAIVPKGLTARSSS